MRHIIARLLLTMFLASLAAAETIYIAPDGRDAWKGTLPAPNADKSEGPVATLERARDLVRLAQTARNSASGAIVVELRGGDYFRDRVFELSAEDGSRAPDTTITYRAAPGETVRLLGGRRLSGFEPVRDAAILERLEPAARGQVAQIDLKAAGVTDFGKLTSRGFGRAVIPAGLELFFDHRPMTLARWPDDGWVKTTGAPAGPSGGVFTYEGDRPKRWATSDDLWVHGYWTWDWANSYEQIASLDSENRQITTAPPHGVYGYAPGKRFYFLNVLEELDQPGEWYLDRMTGVLYFWPPAPIEGREILVSVLEQLISIKGAARVSFEHLGMEAVRGTAITVEGGEDVRIVGCMLRNIGNLAVTVTGGARHGVIGCDISETGDGGISMTGGERKSLTPCNHLAENNDIWHFGRWDPTYRPAISIGGVGIRVAHNLLHDAPHMAMYLGGNEHVLEYNEVHTVCMDTDDAGTFYMGRDWTERGNVVRFNYWHDIGQYKGHVGVQSIYLDDWASGTRVEGNLVVRGSRGLLMGGGRDNIVENNVFVDCHPAVHVDSRGLGWAKNYFDGTTTTLTDRLNAMPYREDPWKSRYPQLLTLYQDEPAVAKGNVITRNICVGGKWLDLHNKLTDKIVRVESNLVDEDPGFVDAGSGNYQLRDDSPAFAKIDFKRLPIEKMGLYQDARRASWPPASRAQQASSKPR